MLVKTRMRIYDADGNMTSVALGGTTIDSYTYNASNQRVRIDDPSNGNFPIEFFFNPDGQHTSSYMDNYGWEYEGWNYWGDMPVAFYADGAANFEHQDWLGTERMRTTYNGQVQGSFTSLPFGDAYTATGNDWDARHFAGLDYDWESDTYHAQYRQYSPAAGRWMSPDLYSGSYDPSNPQSFNRYSYVLNNPLAGTDPDGLIMNCEYCGNDCPNSGGSGGTATAIATLGISLLVDELESIFSGPGFQGSLKPRPNNNPWSEYSGISYGPDIAGALGLPDPGCDFGVCGTEPQYFTPTAKGKSGTLTNPFTVAYNFSFIFVPFLGIGPAVTISYVPSQHLLCLGGGVGASAGHNVSVGAVFLSAAKAKHILGGASLSLGGNSTPLTGAQTSINSSGSAGGYSAGVPGVSAAATYSGCFPVGG